MTTVVFERKKVISGWVLGYLSDISPMIPDIPFSERHYYNENLSPCPSFGNHPQYLVGGFNPFERD